MSFLVTMVTSNGYEVFFEAEDFRELATIMTFNRHVCEVSNIISDTCETFFVVEYEDGIYIRGLDEGSYDQWFTQLAKTIAFDDCSGERVLYIMYKGKELHYTGWKPGMLYEFADKKGNIIWSNSFPEWDH